MIQQIPVYMPEDEAKKFIFFVEHFDDFRLLIEKNVFDQKNARVILHFDNLGILQRIDREDILFYRKFSELSPSSTALLD